MSIQTTERFETIRLSLPTNIADDIKNMRLIGSDLVVYVQKDQVPSVTKVFTDAGFNRVERVFKVHVSALSEQTFTNRQSEYRGCVNGRHIYTVLLDTQEEYNNIISSSSQECTVKPFRSRFAKHHNTDTNDEKPMTETRKQNRDYNKKFNPNQRNTKNIYQHKN